MARPKREIIPPKTHSFVVRLDDVQYGVIEHYAKELGISKAEYIRRQAVHGKVEIHYPIVAALDDVQKLTDELMSIGNNLNQIARYFNTGGIHGIAMQEAIYDCIRDLKFMRQKVLSMVGDFHGNTQTPVK